MDENKQKSLCHQENTGRVQTSPMDDLPALIDASLQWAFNPEPSTPPTLLPWVTSMEQSGLGNSISLQRIMDLYGRITETPENRVIMAEIISEMRRIERAFLTAASHLDPLTGLRTRRDMIRTIEQEVSRFQRSGTPFCVAIADIDHFKLINDTFGHDAGDRVLVAIADEINSDIRTFDDAFRMGGEEFLICLKDISPTAGQKTLERLRQHVESLTVNIGDGQPPVRFTISIGVACAYDIQDADRLIQMADESLYRAKTSGRNQVVCHDGMNTPDIFGKRATS
ncbi:MAG TPA: diguanylate cyclase [Rhodospirillaceae bacterium]|nr:MAG: hypothetical protein A2018_07115 [Alphaproteobacteria bacterium GWF2_58_20]HAU29244.1 diguanylate cyclase [Rhodospirillaceae bacterium]